jgi:phosphoserine phosphatase
VKFASIVLDVDSTLCGVEGIDWLAQRRGADVAQRTKELTDRAMNGELALDTVYGERLALIRPTRDDVEVLSNVYRRTVAEGAGAAIAEMQRAGIRVVLVSGGVKQAIAPLARELKVDLSAVDLRWTEQGDYLGFDDTSPLTTQLGKLDVVRALGLPRPTLAVGDGATDLAMRAAVDRFIAFTGFTRRAAVVENADGEVASFSELAVLVTKSRGGSA